VSDNEEQPSASLIANQVLKKFGEIGRDKESLAPVIDGLLAVLAQPKPSEIAIRRVLEGENS